MDDVIFAGTATRPPRDFAEVSILLERGAADDGGAGESEVTRRIERGAGLGLPDRRPRRPRRRTSSLLFADAATGAHSPALVSQGKIGAVIAAKPVERRHAARRSGGHFRPPRAAQGCRAEAARGRSQSRAARRNPRRPGAARRAASPPGPRRRALPQADRPDPRRRGASCSTPAGSRPSAPPRPRPPKPEPPPKRSSGSTRRSPRRRRRTTAPAQTLDRTAQRADRRCASRATRSPTSSPARARAARHGRAAAGRARPARCVARRATSRARKR